MALSYHPYFRDKMNAMQTAGLITAVANASAGYTAQKAKEDAGTEPQPNLLDGSNWFFGGTINQQSGQTHTA